MFYSYNDSWTHFTGYCYNQVKLETEEMQKVIQDELKLSPVEKEVTVVYEGEAIGKPEHFWKVLYMWFYLYCVAFFNGIKQFITFEISV